MDNSNALRELTIDAKWETNLEKQKRSIKKLGSYGSPAIPSLEEIITVTTRDEIRQFCLDAIKGIQQENATQNEQVSNNNDSEANKTKSGAGATGFRKSTRRKSLKKKSTRSA
jgi:hypothetical protein